MTTNKKVKKFKEVQAKAPVSLFGGHPCAQQHLILEDGQPVEFGVFVDTRYKEAFKIKAPIKTIQASLTPKQQVKLNHDQLFNHAAELIDISAKKIKLVRTELSLNMSVSEYYNSKNPACKKHVVLFKADPQSRMVLRDNRLIKEVRVFPWVCLNDRCKVIVASSCSGEAVVQIGNLFGHLLGSVTIIGKKVHQTVTKQMNLNEQLEARATLSTDYTASSAELCSAPVKVVVKTVTAAKAKVEPVDVLGKPLFKPRKATVKAKGEK